jgi:predicted amidohydrolase
VKFALAQVNPTIGDFEGNRRLILEAVASAESRGAELVLFPELAICGYPPKDLLERPGFVEASRASLAALVTALSGANAAALVGFPEPLVSPGRGLSNSAALIDGGRIVHVARKSLLPPMTSSTSAGTSSPRPRSRPSPSAGAGWGSRSARTSGTTRTSGPNGFIAAIPSSPWSQRARR